jgi:rhodanese-related sulfurtransferase
MGLPGWQIESTIRMSFGPADTMTFIEEACARIRACGDSLRRSGLFPGASHESEFSTGLLRLVADGACSYVFSDTISRRCVVVDPRPGLKNQLLQLLASQNYAVAAVLDTCYSGDDNLAATLRSALSPQQLEQQAIDSYGWPIGVDELRLGDWFLTRQSFTGDGCTPYTYLIGNSAGIQYSIVGDIFLPDTLENLCATQRPSSNSLKNYRLLAECIRHNTLLLPGHDHEGRLATTLDIECMRHPLLSDVPSQKEYINCSVASDNISTKSLELDRSAAIALAQDHTEMLLLDVRESYEQGLCPPPDLGVGVRHITAPLWRLPGLLPELVSHHAGRPIIFFCRSGNRSEQAARALRRLGHTSAWSLAGGVALWVQHAAS